MGCAARSCWGSERLGARECSCAGSGTAATGAARVPGCTAGRIMLAVAGVWRWPNGGAMTGAVGGGGLMFALPGRGSCAPRRVGGGATIPAYCWATGETWGAVGCG